jgi:hypothetical protein
MSNADKIAHRKIKSILADRYDVTLSLNRIRDYLRAIRWSTRTPRPQTRRS